ncbi:MAG: signal peptidase II [Elusimicrobiota bacterium]|jgi:signal peptidase II|nr:signal peptidase II [Elusimicrobiota bacterium]
MLRLKTFWRGYKAEVVLIPLLFLADRISKILALVYLRLLGKVEILPFFNLTYVENTGAAFGTFQNGNILLALLSIVFLFLIFKWRSDILPYGKFAHYGIILIIAGALGNLYDRIVLGFVVDYFDFIVWPVFNIADSCITIGAVLVFIALIKNRHKK